MSVMQAKDAISYRSSERYKWGRSTEYWKLPTPDLKDVKGYADRSGCAYTIDHHREFARRYFNRRHLGLFAYEDCTLGELTLFCQQRGLDITRPVRETMVMYEYNETTATMDVVPILVDRRTLYKADYISVLNSADKNATFHGFSVLPRELRLRVYTHLFNSYCDPAGALELPEPPPITKASRLLRTESLPVFYQTCLFAIPNLSGGSNTHPLSRVTARSRLYFETLPSQHLGRIRRILLECYAYYILVDISERQKEDQVQKYLGDWSSPNHARKLWSGNIPLDLELHHIIAEVMKRPGQAKLQTQDLYAMIEACAQSRSDALADYQMQVMLREQQDKKRRLMQRVEQCAFCPGEDLSDWWG